MHTRRAPECVFETLALLRNIHPDRPFPFFPRKPWQKIRNKVKNSIGLDDHRFHGLRHRCATEIIEKNGTLHDVQFYLVVPEKPKKDNE